MKNIYKINKAIIASQLEAYKKLSEIWCPVKSIRNISLLRLSEYPFYLVDTAEQLDILYKANIDFNLCYFGPFKSIFDLDNAIKRGITKFIISSEYELKELLGKTSIISSVFLTVNPSSILNKSFDTCGLEINKIEDTLNNEQIYNKIEGLNFHLQSPYKTLDNYCKIVDNIIPILNKYNYNKINLGGIPYPILSKLTNVLPKINDFHIIVEPGNSLFSDATTIETKIIYADLQNKIIHLNIGIYSGLIDSLLFGNNIKINCVQIKQDTPLEKFKIFGPSADNLDYLGEHLMPPTVKIGDTVRISNCGIYSLYLNTDFYPKKFILRIV